MLKLKQFLKKYWFTILTLSVTMSILLVFLFKKSSPGEVLHLMRRLHPTWLLLTLSTVVAAWLLEGLGYWLLGRRLCPGWRYGQSFLVGVSGIFYGSITPLSSGGPPMQIFYMDKMGMEPGESAAIISAKTITYQVTMFVFSLTLICTALPFFIHKVSHLMIFTVFGLVTNILFIVGVLLVSFKGKIIDRPLTAVLRLLAKVHIVKDPQQTHKSIVSQFETFRQGFRVMGRDWKLYIVVCIITIAQLLIGSLDTYCIYRAFGLSGASLWLMMAAKVFALMVVSFVPLPGNSGGVEASFEAFCRIFFGSLVTPALLVWRLLTYYGGILFGFLCFSLCARKYVPKEAEQKE